MPKPSLSKTTDIDLTLEHVEETRAESPYFILDAPEKHRIHGRMVLLYSALGLNILSMLVMLVLILKGFANIEDLKSITIITGSTLAGATGYFFGSKT
jgi:hypothetical protein